MPATLIEATTSKLRAARLAETDKPRLRADAFTLKRYGCFLPDGDVLCFCNTEPRIKAIRRVTRKESSPNLGREFWSCGNWVEGSECGFFLWCDQAASLGRETNGGSTAGGEAVNAWTGPTPKPPARSRATLGAEVTPSRAPVGQPLTPSSSPQKRARLRTPPPLPLAAAVSSPFQSRSQAKPVTTDLFDDIDSETLNAGLAEEIEDADDDSPSAPASSPSIKRPRFESFTSPAAKSATTIKSDALDGKKPGGYDAIRADPDSPFHALRKELFGAGTTRSSTTGSNTFSSPTTAPSSSQASPLARQRHDDVSPLDALLAGVKDMTTAAEALEKEREKEERLKVAAKRKEEVLKKAVERSKAECEALRRENEVLKERIRILEEENNELRIR